MLWWVSDQGNQVRCCSMQGCCGRHCAQPNSPAAQCNGQTAHRAPRTFVNLFHCLTHLMLRHNTVLCTSESSVRILSGHHLISVTLRLLLFLLSGNIEKTVWCHAKVCQRWEGRWSFFMSVHLGAHPSNALGARAAQHSLNQSLCSLICEEIWFEGD